MAKQSSYVRQSYAAKRHTGDRGYIEHWVYFNLCCTFKTQITLLEVAQYVLIFRMKFLDMVEDLKNLVHFFYDYYKF